MQLKKSEGQSKKQLYTGFFSGKVVAINPTKEELADLLGYELKDDATDIKYEGQTEKGEDFINISFWLEADTPEKQKFNARFRIVDKPLISQNSGKQQFVNQTGGSTWVDDEKNLPEWFTKYMGKDKKPTKDKQTRAALQGEANLYVFMRAWLTGVDFFDADNSVFLDMKKAFRNLDKTVNDEYRSLLKVTGDDKLIKNVVALATVYSTEKDGELKMYQNLYNEFLGEWQLKKINYAIQSGIWDGDKGIQKYYNQLMGEHGCKDSFTLTSLQPFDPANHQQTTNNTLQHSGPAEDTDY
jgi:hypothetical protein